MTQTSRSHLYRHFHRIAWLATALAAALIVFGAFVRLSNAGLSCPDWPTCYGRAAWPTRADQIVDHAATAIRAVDPSKAWREQFHRMVAGVLGVLVLALALLAARRRRWGITQILAAAVLVATSIHFYMSGYVLASAHPAEAIPAAAQTRYFIAGCLAVLGEAVLLLAAMRWSNLDAARASALTLAVIIFQALLGMWTVTWLLKPIVVMGHLVGGLTTFALLAWTAWRATDLPILTADARRLRQWLIIGLVLLGTQIALGGWTSANYAAWACGTDFPKCAGDWWPEHNFHQGFVLWRGIGVDYEGGILDNPARVAIQMAHRLMAGVVFVYLLGLAVKLLRMPGLRGWGMALALLACVQVGLGISNVMLALPLSMAILHNAGAVALLFVLVTLLARLRPPEGMA
ncbi:MAG: COX15/CtaA family protein [Thermomonas sp.]|uniref:COX15/CtaA family protein n=1 Tax=Thermomonas sp. TaxID=1971895 RepID=UPI00261EEFBF|nr:COX15/CtaA family protein [Thermomonas sp.]MCC7097111.1 COX15/CtaA family protein [Thermomonas sp.]